MPMPAISMILNAEQLVKIRELAALFLTYHEIASLMDLDTDEMLEVFRDQSGPAYKAYFKGKTESKKEIREKVILLARKGSPQAEELVSEYIQSQYLHEQAYDEG